MCDYYGTFKKNLFGSTLFDFPVLRLKRMRHLLSVQCEKVNYNSFILYVILIHGKSISMSNGVGEYSYKQYRNV